MPVSGKLFIGGEQVRIEGEAAGDYLERGADAIDAVGDFVDTGAGCWTCGHRLLLLITGCVTRRRFVTHKICGDGY